NEDARPFRVTNVKLSACVNTAVPCDDYPVDVVIPPGEERIVFRLRKQVASNPFAYEWGYAGESLEPIEIVVTELAQVDEPTPASAVLPPGGQRSSATRIAALDLQSGGYLNALDAVRVLRPRWLDRRTVESLFLTGPRPQVRVY